MNLDADLALSYYKELTVIHPDHQVSIVQHVESRQIFVKKVMDIYHEEVYRKLQQHPINGVPEIHEIIKADNQLILIEQYITGINLEEYLASEPVDDHFIQSVISSLCEIVRQLHSMTPPVIHRDIKPSNIMISPQGDIWLLDFNAAKPYSTDKDSDTVLIGTHGYAAPEQYGFAPSSPQTDIFAIGMVIKELSEKEKLKTHRFDHIIDNCTRLDPKDRYASVSELLHALEQESGQSVLIRSDAPSGNRKKDAARKSGWKSFLLPGLASRFIPVRIISFLGYLVLGYICYLSDFKCPTPLENRIEQILEFFLFLLPIFALTNFRNIQHVMPLCRSKHWVIRFLGAVLLAAILIVIMSILMILALGLWDTLKY